MGDGDNDNGDNSAGPSLILARHDHAHREHLHRHQHHHHLHKRQAAGTTKTVTEFAQTVSVLKQVDVDSQGHTLTIQTFTDGVGYTSTPVPPSLSAGSPAPTSHRPQSPRVTRHTSAESAASSQPPQSLPPNPVVSSTPPQSETETLSYTSTPSLTSQAPSETGSPPQTASAAPPPPPPPPVASSSTAPAPDTGSSSQTIPLSTPTPLAPQTSAQSATLEAASAPLTTPFAPSNTASFSSFIVPPNSTTLISSLSSLSQTFSNSSASNAHSTYDSSSRHHPTTTIYSGRSTETTHASVLGGPAGFPGGGTPASPTGTSGSGSVSHSSAPSTPVVVGSVVGSVAGASIIILILLVLVKWWKRRQNGIALGDGEAESAGTGLGGTSARGMIQRRSLVPAALAGLASYKRSPQKPDPTFSQDAGGERGFYRVSGRKIQSVLESGGDGYGDNEPRTGNAGGPSFYKESGGLFGGPVSPTSTASPTSPTSPSSPPLGISIQRQDDNPIMRPGPARTPVTQQGPFSSMVPPPLDLPPRRPDAVGRSRPSEDSSHPSRFTELV